MVRQHRHSNQRVPSANQHNWSVPARGRGLSSGNSATASDEPSAAGTEQSSDGWLIVGVVLAAGLGMWYRRRTKAAAADCGTET